MNATIRNILAVIIGLIVGSGFNGGLISVGSDIIPPPAGFDLSTMEGLAEAMQFFELKHFIFPFLAHAVGTFIGAFVAAIVAGSHKLKMALLVGVLFLLGGIYMVVSIPSPLWFNLVDLILAYIPMSYLAGKIILKYKKA